MQTAAFLIICLSLLVTSSGSALEKSIGYDRIKNNGPVQCSLSPRTEEFIGELSKSRDFTAPWFNHQISEYPIFILDSLNDKCVAYWGPESGASAITLSADLQNEYGTYESIFVPEAYPNVRFGSSIKPSFLKEELQEVLRKKSQKFALVWIYGSVITDRSEHPLNLFPSELANSLRLSAHEAFHFFVQANTFNLNKVWTDFGENIISDEYLQQCYLGNKSLEDIHRQEMRSLLDAFLSTNKDEKKNKIEAFINYRKQRYSSLDNIEYKDFEGGAHSISCREAEARQELVEGVPQFVGNQTVLDLSIATRQEISDEVWIITEYYLNSELELGQRPIQSYYHTGAVILALLKDFLGDQFVEFTKEISQPTQETFLFERLSELMDEI